MEDRQLAIETSLVNRDQNAWLGQVDDICEDHGFFEQLGDAHCAGFLQAGTQLLVTFENVEDVRKHNVDAEPRGFAYARHDGWSHLAILSFGESWFRDPAVYAFFDRLDDDGFFEGFERIVFYGGDGGSAYAAAAYSVSAPGAVVLALRPQATLDAKASSWDPRYRALRTQDFTSRYGYAPEMIDGASKVFVAYDPLQVYDACHAALFRKPHVTYLPCHLIGERLDYAFDRLGIHDILLRLVMDDALDAKRFAQLLRARRYDQVYGRDLVTHLVETGHPWLAKVVCGYMINRGRGSFFRKALNEIAQAQEEQP